MATRARPAQLRTHPRVQSWQAEVARRASQARTDLGRGRRYRWPADRQAIITETLAAARAESTASEARDPGPGADSAG